MKNETSANKSKSLKFSIPYQGEDPLSMTADKAEKPERDTLIVKKANLTIRLEDEARIVGSIHDAGKKLTTGSIYSVVVDVSRTGTLDIGVKDLNESVLAVSLLKRENDRPGAGEAAGKNETELFFYIV
jgi:hypothetical protein